MAYKGQPFPSTVHERYRAKVSDGKSVRVTVPENTTIESGKFYLLDGFFGAAMHSVETGKGETAEVILNIEQAEYETDQTTAGETFNVGDKVYWNENLNRFTADEGGETPNRLVGRVTQAKDANNVFWFILGPQI